MDSLEENHNITSNGQTVEDLLKPKDHEHLYSIITEGDEVTWQSIILDLVKDDDMDPWNIDVSKLTQKYLKALKKLKESNLRVSGKVILAAALLLRIKSSRLVGEDLLAFDQMLSSSEDDSSMLYEEEGNFISEEEMRNRIEKEKGFSLVPRTPQPRKRKVSVLDLIDALEQALNVKRRRVLRHESQEYAPTVEAPKNVVDISVLMDDLYSQIKNWLIEDNKCLRFRDLCPDDSSKHDKVLTFMPLLHLSNGQRINLNQKVHFGDIDISLCADELIENALPDNDSNDVLNKKE